MSRLLLIVLLLGAAAVPLAAQPLPGNLIDVTVDPGAPDWCGISHLYTLISPEFTQMGGASCADFDNDGWVDVFLPGNLGENNKLYRNLGNGSFVDVADSRGVTDPATATASGLLIDYDNDGDLDLVTGGHAGNAGSPVGPLMRLFRNGGEASGFTFEDVSDTAGFALAATTWPTSRGWQGGLAAGDYDLDGFLDVFGTWWWDNADLNMWRLFHSVPNRAPGNSSDPGWTPRVFMDATIESGLDFPFAGAPWQPRFMDVDRDGWPDLHVAIDFDLDYMFRNNGDGTFTDVAADYNLNGVPPEERNEMGSARGDVDNDGDFDLHLTNLFEADRFYRNDSNPSGSVYVDVALQTGLNTSAWGWGTIFFDFDNDGDLDHAAVSGFKLPTVLPYYNSFNINLYPQTYADGITVKWQNAMIHVPQFSKIFTAQGDAARGLTWLDYDNDGDLDLVVTRHQDTTAVYRNTLASPNRWLQVDLEETGGSLNTVGATVWVKTSDRVQMREVVAGSSFLCQEPPRLHFGLGPAPDPGTWVSGPGTAPTVAARGTALAGPLGPGKSPAGVQPPATAHLDPAWLVVRWLDGSMQIVKSPGANRILTVARGPVNDAGDMNADGHLTAEDEVLLLLAIADPQGFAAAYPGSPGLVVGDLDGNGFVEAADHALWLQLPPH